MTTPNAHPFFPWLTVERRAWLYRVAALLLPIGALYGLVSGEEVALWLPAIAGFLAAPVAVLHTSRPENPLRRYRHERGAVEPGSFALGILVCLLVLAVIAAVNDQPIL